MKVLLLLFATCVLAQDESKAGKSNCGVRNTDETAIRTIVDNIERTQDGEFPWMIVVLEEEIISDHTFNVYKCGGALIHPKIVVTTAHCVVKDSQPLNGLTARAGEWDVQARNERIPHQDRKVVKVIPHEDFNPENLFNDIALLVLKEEFDIKETIDLVCLHNQAKYVDPGRCILTGFGKNATGPKGRYSGIMKIIDLPIVDQDTCQAVLRNTTVDGLDLGPMFNLHSSFICAGGEGKGACIGDGGSPLVCPIPNEKNRYQLTGLVAWGLGCGESKIPGIYTNMAQFKEWIDNQYILNGI